MGLIAGFDFGTSSLKLQLVDEAGREVVSVQEQYPTAHAAGGVSEQNAQDWWDAARRAALRCGRGSEVSAVGVTGQMQDLIPVVEGVSPAVWEKQRTLRPVLLYSDLRAAGQFARLSKQLPDWEYRTANYQEVSSVAAKLEWLAEHEPAVLAGADKLLFGAAGFFVWRLTGQAVCDVLTASTTGLLDVHARDWFYECTDLVGVRRSQLPQLLGHHPGDGLVGGLDAQAAGALGFNPGIPVVHALGDAGAATDGIIGLSPGDAYISLGTTGWLAAVTAAQLPARGDAPSPIHRLFLPGWETTLRIGALQLAGAAADWSRRTFLGGAAFAEIEQLAAGRVSDPAAVAVRPLTLPGLSGERAPVRDPEFRGAFVGVTEETTPIDFHLGVLTGVACGLRHAAEMLGVTQTRIPVIGGASSSIAWRQILADVFGATIVTRLAGDPVTYSAVRAVREALDLGPQFPPLYAPHPDDIETHPSAAAPAYARLTEIHRELYSALAPTFHRLSTIH